jgi:hypothetical protein
MMLPDARFTAMTIVLLFIYKPHRVFTQVMILQPCLTTVFYNRAYNIAIPVDLARKQLVFAIRAFMFFTC